MSSELHDRVVFVTGGASGIGQACAVAYARAGARVVIADIDGEGAQLTVKNLLTDGLAIPCDVADNKAVQSAIGQTVHRFGRIDAVHNNAGLASPSKPLHETREDEWDRLIAVNLKSIYLTTCHAIGPLQQCRGCILNTASMVGLIGQADHAAYVATKGAIVALTKAMALDYAPLGVRVNAVAPAGVWTPMLRQWASEQAIPESITQYLDDIHPLGPCPEADVIADAAVFLLSDRARFITGCTLPVSGGAELGYKR